MWRPILAAGFVIGRFTFNLSVKSGITPFEMSEGIIVIDVEESSIKVVNQKLL